MLLHIPNVLSAKEVDRIGRDLQDAAWADGRHTAGYISWGVKDNSQLPELDPGAGKLGKIVLAALEKNALFASAALPLKILPPLFNRYRPTQTYGRHVDGAIRPIAGTPFRIRTDLSATLFLSNPADYGGGELLIDDSYHERSIKLPAGDMVLYPSTSVHRVAPVTHGHRLASFFWIQSMVRDIRHRTILFELDQAVQHIAKDVPNHPASVDLAGVYHNLLRLWADT